MDELDIQILFDDIGQRLRKAGKTTEFIRDFFAEEGDRVAQEIEDMESE